MAKKSKQLRAALEKIDSTKAYSVEEAVALAKETNFAKFDATVEVAYNLNIDVKKADQQIRGAMVLPNGTGKTQRVLVFARGAKAEEAKAAGADFVGEDDLVATFVLFGVPDPFSTPAAFFKRTAAGGVFVTKVNDLSSYTEITTGIIIPA